MQSVIIPLLITISFLLGVGSLLFAFYSVRSQRAANGQLNQQLLSVFDLSLQHLRATSAEDKAKADAVRAQSSVQLKALEDMLAVEMGKKNQEIEEEGRAPRWVTIEKNDGTTEQVDLNEYEVIE